MRDLLIINAGMKKSEMQSFMKELDGTGIDHELVDLSDKRIAACIQCGKCIKKNYCVNDEDICRLTELVPLYAGVAFADQIIYGDLSENCENIIVKLVHSSSNVFSHHVIVPLFFNRSSFDEEAVHKMITYIEKLGGILPSVWLSGYSEERRKYAVEELRWLLSAVKHVEMPKTQWQRELNFTR